MRRSVENAEHVGLFIPTFLDAPPTRTMTRTRDQQTSTLSTTPVIYLVPQTQNRAGTYLAPARATLPAVAELGPFRGSGRVLGSTMPQVQTRSATTQAPAHHPARVILTPSTSTESLRTQAHPSPAQSSSVHAGRVDIRRADDPFFGSRTLRRPTAPQVDPDSENIPQLC
jgi:hypothetical protein